VTKELVPSYEVSFVTLMYNFSKHGKHFIKLITTSKLRCAFTKAKIFTLGITVIKLTRCDP